MISQTESSWTVSGLIVTAAYFLVASVYAWPEWFGAGIASVIAGLIAVRFFLGRTLNAKIVLVVTVVLTAVGLWAFGGEVRGEHGMIMPQGFAAVEAAVLNALAAAVGWAWVRSSPTKKR